MSTEDNAGRTKPKRSAAIKYINPEIPQVELPARSGERYEVMSPDTLDLAEMATLAINGVTEPTDPEADYEIYWQATFNTNPPMMWHAESDCVQSKHMEALPLLRLASGSGQNLQVEQRWMEVLRQMQGPDGLLYLPKIGRPWCIFGAYGRTEPPGDHYFSPFMEGRLLGAITVYYLLTGEDGWKEAGKRLVDGLNKIAIHEDKKAHFASNFLGVGGSFTPGDPAGAIHNPATWSSWLVQGLANCARHTGYQPALDLAGELSRWIIEDADHFDPSGRFLREYSGLPRTHFHGHTMVLLSLLDYGVIAGDEEAIAFAHRGFEYAMTQGECLLGFFPEWLNMPEPQTLEICELADMIGLAIKLSQSGTGDYWDMADRWTRNLFFEGQLRSADRIYWLAEKMTTSVIAPMELPPYHTAERVVERNIGGFGYAIRPDDFVSRFPYDAINPVSGIIHCCTGNAARTVYYIWENVITFKGGDLRINLLFNRASQWADIDSHIPYTGQVDIKVKQPVKLSIRIPEWVSEEEVTCTVNEQDRKVTWDGRYALLGNVQAKDIVTLRFPISERRDYIRVEKRTYRVLLRGNTCVGIDPPGVDCPLFQREYYRRDNTRWHKVTRFVGEKSIEW